MRKVNGAQASEAAFTRAPLRTPPVSGCGGHARRLKRRRGDLKARCEPPAPSVGRQPPWEASLDHPTVRGPLLILPRCWPFVWLAEIPHFRERSAMGSDGAS